jgi:hypothetical protein
MIQSGISIRRAIAADALSIEPLARSLATTFSIASDAIHEIFGRLTNDEGARILISVDKRGTAIGYLLGLPGATESI